MALPPERYSAIIGQEILRSRLRKSSPSVLRLVKTGSLDGFGLHVDLEAVQFLQLVAGDPILNRNAVEQHRQSHIAVGGCDGLVVVEVIGQGVCLFVIG